jgi:ASC-1-like (ASCH) protein
MQSPAERSVDIKIDKEWFDAIQNGSKTVEGKKNHGKWAEIVAGTTVRFINATTGEIILRKVKSFGEYHGNPNSDPIRDMLLTEGLSHVLPGVTSIEAGVQLYNNLWTGDEKIIAMYGVRAIRI